MNRHSHKLPRREKQESALLGCLMVIAFGLMFGAMIAYSI